MKPRWIEVHDKIQETYAYRLTEPMGGNFHPDFKPELTPKQMLELGVFGGKYMTDCKQSFRRTGSTSETLPGPARSETQFL